MKNKSNGSERVLLVEDEPSLRELLGRTLTRAGYRVETAPDVPAAQAHLAGLPRPPALIVTDVVMPGATGYDLIRWVRERHAGVKVLYISGYAEHAALCSGLIGARDDFLQKPFAPAALARKVREVLDRAP